MSQKSQGETRESPDLPHLCYAMAYFLIPHLLFSDAQKTIGHFNSAGFPVGAYFYAMACSADKVTPRREEALLFQAYTDTFKDGTRVYVI